MSTPTTWPDRSTFQSCAQNPAAHFDDAELRRSSFTPGRMGLPQVWSGGRAMVIKANRPTSGSLAVRFLMHEDREAGARYDALGRHLSSNPVRSMVDTRWVDGGLRIGPNRFPIITMEWVDGVGLDKYIAERMTSNDPAAELRALAAAWRNSCRALSAAGMSHGDVHAGNTLVWSTRPGTVDLRLVDYDNAWVPDLHTPCREAGHPAFQHPDRPAIQQGPYLDAFPNTLTYLSLIALANDPGLWQLHHPDTDDVLLFERRDLENPTTDTWTALLDSSDPQARTLAATTVRWLRGAAGAYQTMEHAIAMSTPSAPPHAPPRPASGLNVWPPRRSGADQRLGSVRPDPAGINQPNFGRGGPGQQGPRNNAWPRPQPAAQAPRPTPPVAPAPPTWAASAQGSGGTALVIIILLVIIAVIAFIVFG